MQVRVDNDLHAYHKVLNLVMGWEMKTRLVFEVIANYNIK